MRQDLKKLKNLLMMKKNSQLFWRNKSNQPEKKRSFSQSRIKLLW
jgi:hypothetical protein